MSKIEPAAEANKKKVYATPKLTRYGKVTELTAGATGTAAENGNGGSKRP